MIRARALCYFAGMGAKQPIIVRLNKNPCCPVCGVRPCETAQERCYDCYETSQRAMLLSANYAFYDSPIDPEGRKYVRPKKRATG